MSIIAAICDNAHVITRQRINNVIRADSSRRVSITHITHIIYYIIYYMSHDIYRNI